MIGNRVKPALCGKKYRNVYGQQRTECTGGRKIQQEEDEEEEQEMSKRENKKRPHLVPEQPERYRVGDVEGQCFEVEPRLVELEVDALARVLNRTQQYNSTDRWRQSHHTESRQRNKKQRNVTPAVAPAVTPAVTAVTVVNNGPPAEKSERKTRQTHVGGKNLEQRRRRSDLSLSLPLSRACVHAHYFQRPDYPAPPSDTTVAVRNTDAGGVGEGTQGERTCLSSIPSHAGAIWFSIQETPKAQPDAGEKEGTTGAGHIPAHLRGRGLTNPEDVEAEKSPVPRPRDEARHRPGRGARERGHPELPHPIAEVDHVRYRWGGL